MSWKAQIAVKCNGSISPKHWVDIKKWPEVEEIWSSTGEWDAWISLNPKVKSTDELESFVEKLREKPWVTTTLTQWWKEVK